MPAPSTPLPPLRLVPDRWHVRLLACHDLTIGPQWNARNVCSPFWRLYVNQAAGAALELAAGLYPLKARRICLVPAWVRFSCRCAGLLEHLYIHFEFAGLPAPPRRAEFDRPLTLRSDPVTAALARRLRASARRPSPDQSRLAADAKALVYLSLGAALQQAGRPSPTRASPTPASPAPDDTALRPALARIEAHPADDLSNERLAALCGLSCDHFARRFRLVVGQTPARYVLERRVAQAAQDLLFTDATIDAIARRRGFANRFHFTRVFAQHLGLPPAAYRRQPRI